MSKTIVAVFAVAFLSAGTLGCQSAAKMAWWKAGDKANVESTALAHSAPALPADVAKQAENFAKSAPSIQMTGGQAAPYAPTSSYSPVASASAAAQGGLAGVGSGTQAAAPAFPSTGASPYSTTAAPALAATTPGAPPAYASTDRTADLGSVDMPYNPSAVPPVRAVAAAPTNSQPTSSDRYGLASTASSYGRTSTLGGTGTPGVPVNAGPRVASTQATRTTGAPIAGAPIAGNSAMGIPVTGTQARQAASGTTVANITVPQLSTSDRYASVQATPALKAVSSVPGASPPMASASMANTSPTYPGSRYPTSASSVPANATTANVTAANPSTDRTGGIIGGRYASSDSQPTTVRPAASSQVNIPMNAPSSPPGSIVPTTTAVAQSSPTLSNPTAYRPGGTDSYYGTASGATAVEIASRPNPVEQQVPNLTTPPSPATDPSQAPRYR